MEYTCWSCVHIRLASVAGEIRYRCELDRPEYPKFGGWSCPRFEREPGSDEQDRFDDVED